jgi:hypothetical protein
MYKIDNKATHSVAENRRGPTISNESNNNLPLESDSSFCTLSESDDESVTGVEMPRYRLVECHMCKARVKGGVEENRKQPSGEQWLAEGSKTLELPATFPDLDSISSTHFYVLGIPWVVKAFPEKPRVRQLCHSDP